MNAPDYLAPLDTTAADFGDFFDELPLWSAPFGLLMLEHVPLRGFLGADAMTVLDVGAGTGFLSLELAQRCPPGSSILAVDPWTAAMDRLRRKVARLDLRNIRCLECDAAKLAIPTASVDLVVSNLGVNNFSDPKSVLAECRRTMKPGARIALTSNLVGHMREFYDLFEATLLHYGDSASLAALTAHVNHRATVDSLEAMLRDAGFTLRRTVERSFSMRFSGGSALLRHHFMRLGFLPAWRDLIPETSRSRFFPELERALDAHAAARGALDLTIPMAYVEAELDLA